MKCNLLIGMLLIMLFKSLTVNGEVVYKPQAKQQIFHNAILNRGENGFRDFLYGGAARGGKSYSLRWEAHRNCLQYPRLRGLLIRSSFPELQRSHLSQIIFDLPAEILKYNDGKHIVKYYNDSVLEFGYGDRTEDFQQYLSAEYDFIMIDELTTIPFDFSFRLRSRLTASRSDFIPFFACATNPGGVAHIDVRNYFVKKEIHDSEKFPEYRASEVCFIPATIYDNQIVIDRDPGQIKRLQQMSKKDQQKYLFGNWDIFEGQFFDEFFSDVHIVKSEDYLSYEDIKKFNCLAGMDYGNYTAVEYMFKNYNGDVCVFDEFTDIKSVRSVKVEGLKKFVTDRGLAKITIYGDTNLWNPDGFDMEYKTSPSSDFLSAGLNLIKVSKSSKGATENRGYRIACNDAIRNALHWEQKDRIFTVKPKLKIYERCYKLIETLSQLQFAENNPEDTKDMGDLDTWYDAMKMGYMPLCTPSEPKMPKTAAEIWEEQRKELDKVQNQIKKGNPDWRNQWG